MLNDREQKTLRELEDQLTAQYPDFAGRRADGDVDIEESRRLQKEVAELRRANEILKTASALFARPSAQMKLLYIHEFRDRFGVEPICAVLAEHGMKSSR